MRIKEIIFLLIAVGVIVGNFFLWQSMLPSIARGSMLSYSSFIVPVSVLVLSGFFFAFVALFVQMNWAAYGALVVATAVPVFFHQADMVGISLFLINLFVIIFAIYRMRKEYAAALSFSFASLVKEGLPLYFTAFALVVSVFYTGYVDESKALSALLPQSIFDIALRSTSGSLESFVGLPAIDPNASVDEVMAKLVEASLQRQGVALNNLPKQELSRFLADQKEQFSKQFGVKLRGDEKIKNVFYQAVLGRVELIVGPYRAYLPILTGFTFFLAFKTITVPLYYLTVVLGFLLIKLLIAGKIIRKEIEQIQVERLRL